MLISVSNLKKDYHSGEVVTKVLRGLTFNIEQEEFVSIMGPSGSGKSTLMHILGFLDRPSSGKYFFEDEDTTKVEDEELARLRNEKVGFVFQTFNLLPRTTVFDNVRLPLLYSKMPESEKDKRAYEVIVDVAMSHRANYFSNQLSGGEQQRVAIARALVNNPAVIFADEPTGNLDSISGVQIMRILQDLNNQGRTVILVTHETYTSEHAKRIISIKDGLIIDDKPVINRRIATDGEILK